MLIYIPELSQEVESSLKGVRRYSVKPNWLEEDLYLPLTKLDLKLTEMEATLAKEPVLVTVEEMVDSKELPYIFLRLQSVAERVKANDLFVWGSLVPETGTPLNKILCCPTRLGRATEEEVSQAYRQAQKSLITYLKHKGYYTYECELSSLNRDCAQYGWKVVRAEDGFLEVRRASEKFSSDERASEHVSIVQVKMTSTREYALAVETAELIKLHNSKLIERRFK